MFKLRICGFGTRADYTHARARPHAHAHTHTHAHSHTLSVHLEVSATCLNTPEQPHKDAQAGGEDVR